MSCCTGGAMLAGTNARTLCRSALPCLGEARRGIDDYPPRPASTANARVCLRWRHAAGCLTRRSHTRPIIPGTHSILDSPVGSRCTLPAISRMYSGTQMSGRRPLAVPTRWKIPHPRYSAVPIFYAAPPSPCSPPTPWRIIPGSTRINGGGYRVLANIYRC